MGDTSSAKRVSLTERTAVAAQEIACRRAKRDGGRVSDAAIAAVDRLLSSPPFLCDVFILSVLPSFLPSSLPSLLSLLAASSSYVPRAARPPAQQLDGHTREMGTHAADGHTNHSELRTSQ